MVAEPQERDLWWHDSVPGHHHNRDPAPPQRRDLVSGIALIAGAAFFLPSGLLHPEPGPGTGLKTVESYVSSIFVKLGLTPDSREHRRVLAVLTFLRT